MMVTLKATLQEMQELMETVTTRGRKVRAAVIGVKMDEATPGFKIDHGDNYDSDGVMMVMVVIMMVNKTPRLAPQRLYLGFSRLGPTLSGVDIIKSIF